MGFSDGSLVGSGVVMIGFGFPPPLSFGFPPPVGFGFDQIGFWVEGGAVVCSKAPVDGGSVAKTTSTGGLVGGGFVSADVGGGDGSGSGQSLLQIASSLQ